MVVEDGLFPGEESPAVDQQTPSTPNRKHPSSSIAPSLPVSDVEFAHTHSDLQPGASERAPCKNTPVVDIARPPKTAEIALAAISTLPTPLLVLSPLKTVVLANTAMGRLLGILDKGCEDSRSATPETVTDILRGQTLSQIGIDMVQDGVPIWVSWEKVLDCVSTATEGEPEYLPQVENGDMNPTTTASNPPFLDRGRSTSSRGRRQTQDTAMDVIVSSYYAHHHLRTHAHRHHKPRNPTTQVTCRMITSIWDLDGERFFTLTFTKPLSHRPHATHIHSHSGPRTASSTSARSSHTHNPPSSTNGSHSTPPGETPSTPSAFLPPGAPAQSGSPSTFTDFQKVIKMKEAMLNAVHIPLLAMWKDESVVFPNLAARRLLAVSTDPTSDDSYDFMSRFKPWSADFSHQLVEVENPIIALCRTQNSFQRWHIGLINEKTGKRSNFDVSGHPVFDDKTGEFFAGLIAFKDVTEYTEKLATQSAENEEQFRLICDVMPQMIWTTRPDGYHDYFSRRWYDYTGLTPADSLGRGWKFPLHDEDLPESVRRWDHSLATGDEYLTEYRCRRHDGQWRWMLGRALPLRDPKTGKIQKWFGTCTDIQDVVDARNATSRTRQQLLDVLKHSQMTMWVIDEDERVTFFEGASLEGLAEDQLLSNVIGRTIHEVMKGHATPDFLSDFKAAIKRILRGTSELEYYETQNNDRWFRSRLLPLRGKKGPNGVVDEKYVGGVIGISIEVTQLRRKEQENIKLLANERAAKEASKMKSNFLANMSHEIRTPIAGVLGMTELLRDTELTAEQAEFAQNIQRSANSLLTVINDILDFSKIESGRLDIEEVQFSLGVVLKDVGKMLSFAAERKGLKFISDFRLGPSHDLILLGDPGRIRQILTNLLTNSIKFTSEGYVKIVTRIVQDTHDSATIECSVEDTGIGIEEEVQRKLFKPFSQADSSTARRFGGTGLGLTICKNLVELMHGKIRLESKLDSGTTTTFTIPFKKPEFKAGTSSPMVDFGLLPDRLQSEPSLSCRTSSIDEGKVLSDRLPPPLHSQRSAVDSRATTGAATLPPPLLLLPPPPALSSSAEPSIGDVLVEPNQREQFHILVVEDNPINQQIAIKFISSLKFSVAAVWNGREALEYLLKATSPRPCPSEAEKYPLPSLILMDVQMPVLDGCATTHLLRHHAPYVQFEAIRKIPIVAMTASAIRGDREKCERAGMDDYMAKPVNRTKLEKMILKWISKGGRQTAISRSSSPQPAVCGDKLSLTSAGTDQSSNCHDHDSIAAEILSGWRVENGINSSEEPPAAVSGNASVDNAAKLRRSSLSRSIIASGIVGGESEGDREMRRAEAEDKARSLRDAKLLSATQSDLGLSHVRTSKGTSLMRDVVDLAGTPKTFSESYPDRGCSESAAGVLALTEENVWKLNKQNNPETDPISPHATIVPADISGPPPDVLLPDVMINSEPLVPDEEIVTLPTHCLNQPPSPPKSSRRSFVN